ncbi:MAG TPA: adenylyl-sulfate kinase, partial [Polyangiaceae bacterium]
ARKVCAWALGSECPGRALLAAADAGTTFAQLLRPRDAKGLYAQFSGGELQGVPGEDLTYEAPERAEVCAHGGEDDAATLRILQWLNGPVTAP